MVDSLFWFSSGLAIVLFITAVILWRQLRTLNMNQNQLQTQLARAEEARSQIQANCDRLISKSAELETHLIETTRAKITSENEVQNLKNSLQSERDIIETAKVSLQDAFKSLASSALEGNTRQFLDLAKSVLDKESELAKADLDKRQQSISALLNPLNQTLDKYNQQLSEMERERQRSYATVEAEIKKVVESNSSLSKTTAALKDALKRPHIRGRWGEVQLKNCIELAGMSEFADVTFQNLTVDDDGQKLIPDMTVRMPGGRLVIVDAKTPIDAFLAALDAPTEELKTTEMIRHGRHVKEHVKKLSTRAYAESFKDAADFTVMFLPNESFLYAALENEPDLMEFALQKKVLIATPPTLIGLLKVIRFGWNEERLAENAQRISEVGQELHKRVTEFVEDFIGIGKHLDKAKEEWDHGFKLLDKKIISQARKFEELGVKGAKTLPEGLGHSSTELPLV